MDTNELTEEQKAILLMVVEKKKITIKNSINPNFNAARVLEGRGLIRRMPSNGFYVYFMPTDSGIRAAESLKKNEGKE